MSHMSYLARALGEDGHEVVITSSSDIPGVVRRFVISFSRVIFNRFRTELGIVVSGEIAALLLAVLTLIRCWRRGGDVINAQSVYAFRFLPLVAKWCRARLVLTVHGYAVFEPESQRHIRAGGLAARHFAALEAFAFAKADEVVAVDSRIRAYAAGIAGRATVHLRKNFLDPAEFQRQASRAAALERLGLPAESKARRIVLCPRRLVPKNGVENAILAMTDPALERLGALLVVVGAGQEWERLHALVDANRLESGVWFAGRMPHEIMAQIYPAADCVIVPSVPVDGVEEATSVAVLESMAAGIPVIGSAVGGIQELIIDGTTGLLVPPAQPRRLAEAIQRVLLGDKLAASLAANARRLVDAEHDYRAAGRFFSRVYAGAL